ncbi:MULTISPECIES: hypothetical protein [Streptomyces]|uniref:Secreted protein n=1 Tax=Streptomyces desertarenae TaxID=2666184 RepID=A0ABW4PLX0_9ACTN
MRRLVRLSAVGAGICCALFVSSPAATAVNNPETGIQMCSEQSTYSIVGNLIQSQPNQVRSCMSSAMLGSE